MDKILNNNSMKIKRLIIAIACLIPFMSEAQLVTPFNLSNSATTDHFMKFVPKGTTINASIYTTGFVTLSAYKNVTTNTWVDPGTPVQKLQIQGGNILLCKTNVNFNPTSKNGAILFGDNIVSPNYIHGKWGIEYDDQFSSGGLNIFNPPSEISSTRRNFNLFISNSGNVGIGLETPQSKLHVNGELTVSSLSNSGRNKLIVSDEKGKLQLIDASITIDNMGNCVPTHNISLGEYFISYDGSSNGLSIDKENNVLLKNSALINNDLSLNGNALIGGRIKGLTNTTEGLIIQGSSNISTPYIQLQTGSTDVYRNLKSFVSKNSNHQFLIDNKIRMIIKYDQVVLGQAGQDQMSLNVNGIINAREIKVSTSSWSDFVFNENYRLLPLADLVKYIEENNHLPDVPTESDVINNGVNIGEMNAILLQKIEELTLYVIHLQDEINTLKKGQ